MTIRRRDAKLIDQAATDPFEISYSERDYQILTDAELYASAGSTYVFDSEVYVNYFLIAFKCIATKRIIYFEDSCESNIDLLKLRWILTNCWIVGFNSNTYDLPLITLVMLGWNAPRLKEASNRIIREQMFPRRFESEFKCTILKCRHIDLIEVAPLQASLKIYGGRVHTKRMQELPVKHDAMLTQREARAIKFYCFNDLDCTIDLFNELRPQLTLRYEMTQQYGQDLMSKSDAQIAETVITSELKRMTGYWPKRAEIEAGTTFNYIPPEYIRYETEQFQKMLETVKAAKFTVTGFGYTELPPEIEGLKLRLGQCIYRMGIGGLHTSEECVAYHSDEEHFLIDKDVASYYPAIILNNEFAPKHLGKNFLRVYRDIVNRRLEAKRAGNKVVADSLKITINGVFGKLGNKYSALYSPDLMIQVTITGQLALLLLVEMMEKAGIPVLSANTDGILLKCHKSQYPYLEALIVHWQRLTGFETEETRYKAIYCRDINNYIAIKEDGEHKSKGVYSEKGSGGNTRLSKNPEMLVCSDAVIAFLAKGKPIRETILACKDVRRFVSVRHVKGGGEKSGRFLGRAVRWYYSKKAIGEINYISNGNKVPKSDGAMPLTDLPDELPEDVDFDYYIKTADAMLNGIGYHGKQTQARLF